MAYEMKDNTGTLFVNAHKTNDKHPDRKGSVLIDGEEWEIAGWIASDREGNIKHDKNGNPMLNMKFSRKAERPAPVQADPALDDGIPF